MATTPSPYPAFPSATTYPPHPFGCYYPPPIPYPHQIHHHHPFPFGFSSAYAPGPPGPVFFQPPPAQTATTAFSYAATYPYSPPASAYTAASGAPTAPAYGPSGFSSAAAIPSTAVPPAPTQEHLQPPPPTGALSLSATTETALLHHPEQVPSAHLTSPGRSVASATTSSTPTSDSMRFSPLPPAATPATASKMQPESTTPAQPKSTSAYAPAKHTTSSASSLFRPSRGNGTGGESINSEQQVHKQSGPEILSMANSDSNNSFVTNQGQFQSSFDSLHGELSKLSALVSQFAVKMGLQTTEVLVPGPPLLESTASAPLLSNTTDSSPLTTATTSRTNSARLFPVCSMHTSTGTASAVPQVFGEMPIPQSGYEYCPGHHNISLNTCVLDRNSNLSEQNMDGMPQAYGFHNLNCKSVVLEPMFAVYEDETDSSSSEFFDVSATPTDRLQSQPFEQLPVFNSYDDDTDGSSTESVGVFTSKPEQQQYEEKHQEDVHDLPLELQQQDDEKACNVPVLKASDSVVTSSSQLSSENIITELRLLWDPGASTSLYSSKAELLGNQVETHVQQLRDTCQNVLVTSEKREEWDPGDTKIHDLYAVAAGATKLPCTYVYNLDLVHVLAENLGAQAAPIFASATVCYLAFEKGWIVVNASADLALAVQFSEAKQASVQVTEQSHLVEFSLLVEMSLNPSELDGQLAYRPQHTSITSDEQWDPGIDRLEMSKLIDRLEFIHQQSINENLKTKCIYMLLHKLPNSVQFIKQKAEHFILSLTACMQHIASNDISYVLQATCFVLQRSAHITQGNYICSWYCNSVLKMSSVWDPGVKISLHSWLDISTVWSATDKPLSCTHIPDLAAWQNQSIGSGACYIWDPGTILWYTFIWLALATVRETLYAYYLALRHSNGRCVLYSENIICYLIVYSVLEEKKMPNGPSTRFWTSKLEPMQCTYYYETCNSQQYSHQDITFCEIALLLIHFKPP